MGVFTISQTHSKTSTGQNSVKLHEIPAHTTRSHGADRAVRQQRLLHKATPGRYSGTLEWAPSFAIFLSALGREGRLFGWLGTESRGLVDVTAPGRRPEEP